MKFDNSNQFNAFIKKEANRLGISNKNARSTFYARQFLEAISKNNDQDILLKGSASQLVNLGQMCRAITDIDIASENTFNEANLTLSSAFGMDDRGITYDITKPVKRTQTGIYKMSVDCSLDKTRDILGIDFQENYNRLIEPTVKVFPKIFEGDKEFEVYIPSYEEYLAEKICIILESNKDDVLNTRVKDFYDIYELHGGKYDPDKLSEYFKKMLKLRGKINLQDCDTRIFTNEFINKHQEIWDRALKLYEFFDEEVTFAIAVSYARAVAREELLKSGQEMKENRALVRK